MTRTALTTRPPSSSLRRNSRHTYPTVHLRRRNKPSNSTPRSPPFLPHSRSLIRPQRHASRNPRRIPTPVHAKQHRHHDIIRSLLRPHNKFLRNRWLSPRPKRPQPHRRNCHGSRKDRKSHTASQWPFYQVWKIPQADCEKGGDRRWYLGPENANC